MSEKGLDCWYIERSKTLGVTKASDPSNSHMVPKFKSNKGEKGNVEQQGRGGCEQNTSQDAFENIIRDVIHRVGGCD